MGHDSAGAALSPRHHHDRTAPFQGLAGAMGDPPGGYLQPGLAQTDVHDLADCLSDAVGPLWTDSIPSKRQWTLVLVWCLLGAALPFGQYSLYRTPLHIDSHGVHAAPADPETGPFQGLDQAGSKQPDGDDSDTDAGCIFGIFCPP